MSKTKSKLFAAAVMLMVSVLLLTSASFAWFTISTNPEVSDMTTQIVTNENLEVALAKTGAAEPDVSAIGSTGNQYAWGNIIDLGTEGDAKDAYDLLTKTLRPATLATTFQYPTYGADGRPNELTPLTVGAMANGFGVMEDADKKVYGYYVDFWLRSNIGGTVTLSTATKRSTAGDTGGGTVFTTTNKVLAENIALAVQPNPTATTPGAITAMTRGAATGTYTTAFTGNVVTLTANTAQLVRVYVYLDGKNVTNAAASLEDALVNGALNIQFAMTDVDQSMDGQA